MSLRAFATGVAKGFNQQYEQKEKAEQQWRMTTMQNFLQNTVPAYREDKRKATKKRQLATDGIKYLASQKGFSPKKAEKVAWAYADKYDNHPDYLSALRKDIAGPADSQTQAATARETYITQDEALGASYDNLEAFGGYGPRQSRADFVNQFPESTSEASYEAGYGQAMPEEESGPSFFENVFLGQPDYQQASEDAYQQLAQQTGYSPGMIKLMEMGQSVSTPQGSLSGVEFNADTGDLGGLESQIFQNWGQLDESSRQAYQQYRETGNTEALYQAANGLPAGGSTDYFDQLEDAATQKVHEYQLENPQATPEDMMGLPADNPYHMTQTEVEAYYRRLMPDMMDLITRNMMQGRGGTTPPPTAGEIPQDNESQQTIDDVEESAPNQSNDTATNNPAGVGVEPTIDEGEAGQIAEQIANEMGGNWRTMSKEERGQVFRQYTGDLNQADKQMIAEKLPDVLN